MSTVVQLVGSNIEISPLTMAEKRVELDIAARAGPVLVLSSSESERQLITAVLAEAQIAGKDCQDLESFCCELGPAIEAAVVAEEYFAVAGSRQLQSLLMRLPSPELPVIVLSDRQQAAHRRPMLADLIGPFGNITFLERPVQPCSLISVVHAALRTRRQQDAIQALEAAKSEREEEVWDSHQSFQAVADATPDILFTTSPDGSCNYVNSNFYRFTGWRDGAALGYGWQKALHPEDIERVCRCWPAADAEGPAEIEFRFRSAEGCYRWFVCRGRPMRDRHGNIVRWFGNCTDIDDRKRGMQQQLVDEHLERRVAERTEALSVLYDVASAANEAETVHSAVAYILRRVSDHHVWNFGHAFLPRDEEADELLACAVWHSPQAQEFAPLLGVLQQIRLPVQADGWGNRVFREEHDQWTQSIPPHLRERRAAVCRQLGIQTVAAVPVRVGNRLAAVLEFFAQRHQTPNSGVEESLLAVAAQLGRVVERKHLEREIAEATICEQRRIGHELHDSVAQQLTGIGLLAENLRQRLSQSGAPEASEVAQLVQYVQQAQREVRRLSRGLMPVEIDGNGLMSALEELARHCRQLSGTPCQFHCLYPVRIDDNSVATQLFRIAQEAVHRAVRDEQSRRVVILLQSGRGRITLRVQVMAAGKLQGLGEGTDMAMRVMRYRAGLIGAMLEVEQHDGGSASIVCTLKQVENQESGT